MKAYSYGEFVCYVITNNVNGKRYVGLTNDYVTRMSAHRRSAQPRGTTILSRALHKYGFENFTFEVASVCPTYESLIETEVSLIAKYDTRDRSRGYNITSGGQGCPGRVMSEEHRKLMGSIAKVAHLHTPEARAKARASNTGKLVSDETKEKIRGSLLGRKKPDYKKSKIVVYPIIRRVTTPDGVFNTAAEAARHHGIDPCTLRYRVKKGYPGWSYEGVARKQKPFYGVVVSGKFFSTLKGAYTESGIAKTTSLKWLKQGLHEWSYATPNRSDHK